MITYLRFVTVVFFFFKQKTAYEMRISDWSSDVCSFDLARGPCAIHRRNRRMEPFIVMLVLFAALLHAGWNALVKSASDPLMMQAGVALTGTAFALEIGRASCGERGCQSV